MIRTIRRLAATAAAVALLALSATAVAAHTHSVGRNGQVLANGQNHPAFNPVTFESCVTNTLLPGFGPAWYGLETAHHGPDSGDAGKGDGCYKADASPLSEADDVNPAID
ncbi:MAG TPA: hypothetical protein VM451_02175 [Candidatus Limnocylindria bacterium]|nr:hypothetical protein [Candidatus Limnocylindria bacterium]